MNERVRIGVTVSGSMYASEDVCTMREWAKYMHMQESRTYDTKGGTLMRH